MRRTSLTEPAVRTCLLARLLMQVFSLLRMQAYNLQLFVHILSLLSKSPHLQNPRKPVILKLQVFRRFLRSNLTILGGKVFSGRTIGAGSRLGCLKAGQQNPASNPLIAPVITPVLSCHHCKAPSPAYSFSLPVAPFGYFQH